MAGTLDKGPEVPNQDSEEYLDPSSWLDNGALAPRSATFPPEAVSYPDPLQWSQPGLRISDPLPMRGFEGHLELSDHVFSCGSEIPTSVPDVPACFPSFGRARNPARSSSHERMTGSAGYRQEDAFHQIPLPCPRLHTEPAGRSTHMNLNGDRGRSALQFHEELRAPSCVWEGRADGFRMFWAMVRPC